MADEPPAGSRPPAGATAPDATLPGDRSVRGPRELGDTVAAHASGLGPPAPGATVAGNAPGTGRADDPSRPSHPGGGAFRPVERGTVVGRYVVLARLGAGAMGVVYAAYDPDLDRKVALKLLHPARAAAGSEDEAHRRLLREAQALARLSHPNVVAVHDVGEYEGRVYVAMAFVEGKTLSTWMNEGPRPWKAVVRVFEQAGRGLAAAHEKGLVHRDFKPDNVMVGDDGRVQVMDFGLARPAGGAAEAVRDRDAPAPRSDALGTNVTRAGAVVGTPAYMAPEQWAGGEVGPAADQFSFCVAFWEALYGQRPFAGETAAMLALAITQGKIQSPPKSRRVPRWLHRIVRRGLETAPEDRWPSMDALLAALGRGQGRARLRTAAATLGALALAGAGAEGYRRYDRAQKVAACEAVGRAYVSDWKEAARDRVRAGIAATGLAYAATTADKVLPYLDAHADALQTARTETCLDVTVRRTWDEGVEARSLWCLDERRLALVSLADELSEATPTAVQEAVSAAAGLPRVEPCRDADLLVRLPPPPDAPSSVAEVRKALSRAAILEATGSYDEGLAAARQALERAEALAWPPLVAAARNQVGSLLDRKGDSEAAEMALEDAYFEAMEAGALGTAFDAAARLVFVTGYQRQRHEDGLRWGRHAQVVLRAHGEPDDGLRRAKLRYGLAVVYQTMGDYDRARDLYERTLDIWQRVLGDEHPLLAYPLTGLGNVSRATGDLERAGELYERALDIWQKALGDEHPDLAASLNNLGETYRATGDLERARELFERALHIRRKALGDEHPLLAYPLTGLAEVALAQRRPAEALAYAERAIALRESGKTPPGDLAQSRFALARALWDAPAGAGRDRARALDEARAAADLHRSAQGEEAAAEVEAWLATHRPK